jgi:hypothetical protein
MADELKLTQTAADRAANATAAQTQDAAAANTKSYADAINAQYNAAQQQQENAIDYRTQVNQNNARRAYEDSMKDYRNQYRDMTTDMYQGMDNAALVARANGQFGGSATAEVGAVQSEYQKQRQALSLKQQQMATDTVREIENLRAQGEFDKADALLKSRQQQFQALYEDAVRVDENRWNNEKYQTGLQREDEAIVREQQQYDKAYLQQLGQAFMNMGVMPAANMLQAMGLDRSSAQSYINAVLMGY